MRVLVTGATGFVGIHTVAALVEAGHDVRLFVRSPERVHAHLAPLGVREDALKDVVTGDVTDAAAVEQALTGCDAVVHAASIYSLDPRDARAIERTNVGGTRIVLETAHRLGLDPIVHVSSYAALMPPRDAVVTRDSEPGEGLGVYSRSKCDSERVARELQAKGAPVVSVMPGMVWGPHDPYHGETDRLVTDYLLGRSRVMPRNALAAPPIDVRDVAQVIASALEPGRGARRYLATGETIEYRELMRRAAAAADRRLRTFALPNGVVRATAGLWDAVQRISPWRLPVSTEAARAIVAVKPADASATRDELGVEFRPLEETIRDTVSSLAQRGRI
jgi:dihydroflavonol-4-reductase